MLQYLKRGVVNNSKNTSVNFYVRRILHEMYLFSFGIVSIALFNDLKHAVLSCNAECEKSNDREKMDIRNMREKKRNSKHNGAIEKNKANKQTEREKTDKQTDKEKSKYTYFVKTDRQK